MTSVKADVIFCDDIRQEGTGKFFFIGVYPGDLIPSTLPAVFPMAIFLRIYGMQPGKHPFVVKVSAPGGQLLLEQDDSMETSSPDAPSVLIFSGFAANIEKPGDLDVKITIDGQEILAGTLKILPPPAAVH